MSRGEKLSWMWPRYNHFAPRCQVPHWYSQYFATRGPPAPRQQSCNLAHLDDPDHEAGLHGAGVRLLELRHDEAGCRVEEGGAVSVPAHSPATTDWDHCQCAECAGHYRQCFGLGTSGDLPPSPTLHCCQW